MNRFAHCAALPVSAPSCWPCCWAGAHPAQQSERKKQTPLSSSRTPRASPRNHRLILKDGTYQLVRQYTIAGDRVRYLSLERGDWEEMPADLVDWDATRKWERDHATPTTDQASPAMKEAEDIDKEEADERDTEKGPHARGGQGLELPDEDGVFALDTYQGTPELVELMPSDPQHEHEDPPRREQLNPLQASKANLELEASTPRFTCTSTIRPSIFRST